MASTATVRVLSGGGELPLITQIRILTDTTPSNLADIVHLGPKGQTPIVCGIYTEGDPSGDAIGLIDLTWDNANGEVDVAFIGENSGTFTAATVVINLLHLAVAPQDGSSITP